MTNNYGSNNALFGITRICDFNCDLGYTDGLILVFVLLMKEEVMAAN